MKQKSAANNSKEKISESKADFSLSSPQFLKTWAFWESYSSNSIELSYEDANKKIFCWDNVIKFFQFWNKYLGNNIKNIFFDGTDLKFFFKEKYRINSMNIFVDGIKPMWEDPKNKDGKCLQLEYKIKKDKMDEFSSAANYQWKKLALCTMGMSLPGADYINGIRFIDKTNLDRGKNIMFRLEIWVEKSIEENTLNELTNHLKKELGCEKIVIKNIECK